MAIQIVKESISRADLKDIAKNQFGDLVKAVVDVEKKIMAVGGELHADEEAILLEQGSEQANLWGVNFYVEQSGKDWIEFNSMINVRPSQGNRSRGVESAELREKIEAVVSQLVT